MTGRWFTVTLAAATAIPYGLLGGFGSDSCVLPWVGMLAGWVTWVLIARAGVRRGWWYVAHEDSSSMSPYFAVLGLKASCSRADVQTAYRERAQRHHPDAGGDATKFRELVEAKDRALSDLAAH